MMWLPAALLALSLAAAALAWGAPWPEGVVWAGLVALGALVWLGHLWRRRGRRHWIVVDGSNVMYWDGDRPRLETVARVVSDLDRRGYAPVVWFDANAGYLTEGRYARPDLLARRIGLPAARVHVVSKGMPADPQIIADAERLGARIVTNDRYRDWQEADATLRLDGFLIRGRVAGGQVRLEFPG
ncbi:MAG: hypothetical protein IT542_14175 [Rubellimicrobium sp.]|nr:hypothetical protein [Rubellimicrobium sp.]